MTKQQEEMNDRIQDLHNWYIGGQIILHPERDEVFKNKLLTFLQSEIDLSVAEERNRIVEMISGYLRWKYSINLEQDEILSTISKEN